MNLLLLLLALLGNGSPLRVSPTEWDFGRIEAAGGVLTRDILFENRAGRAAEVRLTSTCDCLSVEPEARMLPAGGQGTFRLRLDPSAEQGEVEKYVMVRTDLPELPKALYLVRGTVAGGAAAGGEERGAAEPGGSAGSASPAAGPAVDMDFYYAAGCRECLRFLLRTVPALERELGLSLRVREHDILDSRVYEEYQRRLAAAGEAERAYPALSVGGRLLQGEREIRSGLRPVLERLRASTPPPEAEGAGGRAGGTGTPDRPLRSRLTLLPVLAAGLLDGINPCAFTTLVFLLSSLAVAGRSRRQVLLIGLCFTAAVFLTYLALGAGLLQGLRLAGAFPVVSTVLRWVLIAGLLALAALSLYDFALVRAGRSREMLLQLPRSFKERIHRDIRTRARAAALAASSLVLGFLVSVFELACTGQVYLPTLAYLVRVRPDAGSFFYLLLYNLGFIAPLAAVFALAFWGVASQRLAAFVQRSLGTVKIALAVLFLGLAVLTYFT